MEALKGLIGVLQGHDGRLSFSKCVVAVIIAYLIWQRQLTLAWGWLLIPAAFGRHTLEAIISRSTFSVDYAALAKAALQRRDPVEGVEPTP